MKTSPVTKDDLTRSVIAVPPLCRNADDAFSINADENRKLIKHLEGGGISTLLYGGNANLYHIAVSEYDALLGMLAESVATDTWVVPSSGPMFGTLMDQAKILADHQFPTAMVLPTLFPKADAGVSTAVRKFSEAAGMPIVLYLKDEAYLSPAAAAALCDDGLVSWIKYAVVRDDPSQDDYLRDLIDRVDPATIVSGIGEQPTVAHLAEFGLAGFTSGCVNVAPSKSMEVLRALKSGDLDSANALRARFAPLEDLRNTHGPIPVLHHAVALASIAETGTLLPMLAELPADLQEQIAAAARELLEWERA